MYRTKKDVDQHVESLISRLSSKEFNSRCYSIGRLYYEVGDYSSCRKYVEQYVAANDQNAAAHVLLGQALQKLGQKENALEEFKTSFSICPSQNSLVLNICEILADGDVDVDPGRAKYWCDKAEALFPKHPITFQLREKLISIANPDPQALINLLTEELAIRPKDVLLHIRLLKFYLKNNKIEEAFTHSCNVEFGETSFINNFDWYKTLSQIISCNPRNTNDWLFQLLLLTVSERMCVLSLTDTLASGGTSIFYATELLHVYDQAIERVAKAGIDIGYAEFHSSLLQHHRSQLAFHAATFLLKGGEDQNWSDATVDAEPLMLIAWHSSAFNPALNWVISAPKFLQNAAHRWYCEGSYRCSQAGHYLLSNVSNNSQSFLDRISQQKSSTQWRGNLYRKIFSSKYHLDKIKTSHLVSSSFTAPTLRFPKRNEVELYDEEAQRVYGNSLHHFVWLLLNYKNYAQFKCTTFEMLPVAIQNDANCGPESLCQLDIYAFLYCATITSSQNRTSQESHKSSLKPKTLPASITELLCTLPQMKWWDCAFKVSRKELGTEMTDIRATLSRGIEVVRCIDNHGLDPELLCELGRIFSNRAKNTTDVDEKQSWEMRAMLYFSSAIPLLEKKPMDIISKSDKRLFAYTNKNLLSNEATSLLEECKLHVALHQFHAGDYEKAINFLLNLKSAQALYYLGVAYKKMALEQNNYSEKNLSNGANSKFVTLLSKAQKYGYDALYKLKDPETKSNHLLHMEIEELLREIEIHLNKCNSAEELSKTSSDQYVSFCDNEDYVLKPQSLLLRNFSSTPKQISKIRNFDKPIDSEKVQNRTDQQYAEPIESPILNLQKQDKTMNEFIDLTKSMLQENRILSNQIILTLNSNMKNTTDQFAQLQISIDQVKYQVDECRNECKDVGELKKQIAELKKDINKLKKTTSEQAIAENELFNLDEEYRTNDTASTYAAQLPYTPQQVMPQFNQRLIPPFPVPPNPFQLYGQNLFNLYNQYSQFSQPPQVPGGPPIFDAARPQVNYAGVFGAPDQMYLDVANLVQQSIPTAAAIPVIPTPTSVSVAPSSLPVVSLPHSTVPTTTTNLKHTVEAKDTSRSLPANVVITSSDPLPTFTTTPAPILSVTIPAEHIKGIPHNYQIQMPATEPAPAFGFPTLGNKTNPTAPSSNWKPSTAFKDMFPSTNTNSATSTLSFSPKLGNAKNDVATSAANDSQNKSRTLSEISNTSVDNYDPCPDFKPIIPLPAEVKVTTGEEDELIIFSARAKLYRFVDNQWKERGLGEMKLLKHKFTGKVRVLMRREQIHKICANHIITPAMEIKPMKNETKAYFWVANDFADETLVLEKFCIRFKTADIARQFFEAFEKARLDSTNTAKDAGVPEDSKITETPKSTPVNLSAKTEFGGFTFSNMPAFKPVVDNKTLGKTTETTSKVNVFSGLQFKSNPATPPFSNLFPTPTTQTHSTNDQVQNDLPSKLNTSDTVEEYEPTTEFKPVVPLPALVETKTGEEDEIVLFEHRAKLLRFVASSKEWKERGLGNIKLLVNKENVNKLRLLMRREQVMKVCCNHAVTKAMIFQKMPKMDKAVTWCAQDFSEGELTPETFCLRFKTIQACNDFIDALKLAQSKLKDESKAAKEEQNAAKQNSQSDDKNTTGSTSTSNWGDKFKPKEGSWECNSCFVRNESNLEICLACNSSRHPNAAKQNSQSDDKNTASSTSISHWGSKFKPKEGSWECNSCFVRNESNVEICVACNSSRHPNAAKQNSQSDEKNTASSTSISHWGSKFKPKEDSWECDVCLVRNEPNFEICAACNSSRHPKGIKPDNKIVPNTEIKFKFGIPNQSIPNQDQIPKVTIKSSWGGMFKPSPGSCDQCSGNIDVACTCNSPKDFSTTKPLTTGWSVPKSIYFTPATQTGDSQKNETTSIFDGTGVHKFNFGIAANVQGQSNNVFSKTDQPFSISNMLKVGKEQSLNNSVQKVESKPALLPTPQKASDAPTFDFVFKPKAQTKAKSPIKSPNDRGEESDGNEYASEDEGHHIHITPIIPMPDKVKVVTGEEDEEELFGHRAKLLIFVSGEWKERGIGVVKILKHKHTGKLRVVMRREQVFKICLNHALTPDIIYNLKDEKNWIFAANDFSEGELSLQRFCLKFKTKDIALQFKDAIDLARDGTSRNKHVEDNYSDEVLFVNEIQSNPEEKKIATELMLPENFFLYKNKEPCPGCRGCKDDQESKTTNLKNDGSKPILLPPTLSVPLRKPMAAGNEATDFTSTLTKSPNVSNIFQSPKLTAATEQFATQIEKGASSASNPKNSSIFGAALNTRLHSEEKSDVKSIFGGESKENSIFGVSLNSKPNSGEKSDVKSIFGGGTKENPIFGAALNSKPNSGEKSVVKSVFGGEAKENSIFGAPFNSKPNSGLKSDVKSVFEGATKENSILGAALSKKPISGEKSDSPDVKSVFGGETKDNSIFGAVFNSKHNSEEKSESKSVFGSDTTNKHSNVLGSQPTFSSIFDTGNVNSEPSQTSTLASSNEYNYFGHGKSTWSGNANDSVTPENNEAKSNTGPQSKEAFLGTRDTLSFEDFSKQPEIKFQTNPNFKWEGAGQQLFKKSPKEKDASDDEHEGNVGEEEYNPHYDPIVPLPDKIIVTTGEEDEEKLFGNRCKLYRFDEGSREWKERGVGEIKILYHPVKKTYRLLFRREQVHKVVLNMLVFTDLELLPMNKSDRAWTWAGRNFAESSAGEQETLAVRFKDVKVTTAFYDCVTQCVRKLQAAAAQAIREAEENKEMPKPVPTLRLPKHLQDSARADSNMVRTSMQYSQAASSSTGPLEQPKVDVVEPEVTPSKDAHKESEDEDAENYDEQVYYQSDDYDTYYNEEDDGGAYFSCDCEASVAQGGAATHHAHAHVQVFFDHHVYSPKILLVNAATGELLCDMLLHDETDFQLSEATCTWTGTDYTSNEASDTTVTVIFPDSETAMQFYDSCESSKGQNVNADQDE